MDDKMTLETNDPKEALRQIANYLRTVNMSRERAVVSDGELHGFWQCTEWLEGLKEIADECDRILIRDTESDAVQN
jgi:hypothetical protein